MKIIEFFEIDNQDYWLEQICKSDWSAGQYLYELLSEGTFRTLCGENARVYLLTEGDELISFCTLAEKDDIRDTELTPWIGFAYTFPKYRGHRYVGMLLKEAFHQAALDGAEHIYISTGETGLYEKYGYEFFTMMKDMRGEDSRVYRKAVADR